MKMCKFWFYVIFSVIFSGQALVIQAGTVPDGTPLPAWETAEEKALRQQNGWLNPENTDTPPTGEVNSYAEWAPAAGVMIAWMGFESFLTEMTREFVQVGKCYIVVESSSQQSSVSSHLTSQGISLDNVEFLIYNMDTVWMVDYGPFFVTVDGNREIIY